jgi:hypothetical protein
MTNIGASTFVWLEFGEDGAIDPAVVRGLSDALKGEVDDLVVISHGWKNDKNDASRLYTTLWNNTCAALPPDKAARTVVAGVLWPSKAYPDDFDATTLNAVNQAGALGLGDGAAVVDISDAVFERKLKEFADFFGPGSADTIAAARVAAKEGFGVNEAQDLVNSGGKVVAVNAPDHDVELGKDGTPIAEASVDAMKAQSLLVSLTHPPRMKVAEGVVKAQGLGDFVAGLFSGPKAAIARFLNLLTYFEMKKRAGVVGVSLANQVLTTLAPDHAVQLHLVGHSFGARLVTAAANQLALASKLDFFSLTLLQGAYSHNGMANIGAFPGVVGKPKGPIVITHTHNDLACTLAYALASRLSRDTTQGIGDAQDEFGAMGANGPQKLDAAFLEPEDTNQTFKPKRHKVNRVMADAFILKTAEVDAHNNVTNPTCGRLLASVITS